MLIYSGPFRMPSRFFFQGFSPPPYTHRSVSLNRPYTHRDLFLYIPPPTHKDLFLYTPLSYTLFISSKSVMHDLFWLILWCLIQHERDNELPLWHIYWRMYLNVLKIFIPFLVTKVSASRLCGHGSVIHWITYNLPFGGVISTCTCNTKIHT